jgi:murein L,D-transpeptidase YafK
LIGCSPIRSLVTAAALAAGVLLAGCNGETLSIGEKATRPIPEKLVAEINAKNMDKGSPMLVRLFKQEAELEVWKQDRTGHFALLKTYPICRWSGDFGPKVREGDRQAPEGFYSITPGQMNPASAYYLSFNMGYPNAYDKAWGRSGSQLMVHGDCSSRGCYAMTDEQISEIYALGRESFFGGQAAFQVQAYPFRMTPQNMAKYRNNPNMPFWKMIKEGNDAFEVTMLEPKVDFCEKKYVFDAEKAPNASRAPVFNASAKCPAYSVPEDIAEAIRNKQRDDELKTAQLITRGTPVARSRDGIDGGMHPVFATKLPEGESAIDKTVTDYTVASYLPAPGTVPSYATVPKAADAPPPEMSNDPVGAASTIGTPVSPTESFMSRLSRSVGLKKSDPAETQQPAQAPQPTAKPGAGTSVAQKSKSTDKSAEQAKAGAPKARVIPLDNQQATAQAKSAFPDPAPAAAPAPQAAATATPAAPLKGAAPTVSSGSFDSRWSSFR